MADFDEMVKVSCGMLAHADSDLDKMSALLYATPCIQSERNDSKSQALLFRSMGPSFLRKMLAGRLDVPLDDDAVDVYRSTALNILVSFCANPEIAKNKTLHKMIPDVFQVLRTFKEPADVLDGSIQYFKCIVQHEEGRQALLAHGALKEFVWMYSTLKSNDALDLIKILSRKSVWEKDNSSFNLLMTSLAEEFANNQTQQKFTICSNLLQILSTRKQSELEVAAQKWPVLVLKGLKDILTSRIEDKQRIPALKLASAMVDNYGMEWAVRESLDPPTPATPKQRQFQLLLVHLSSIECRMQMEDQPISSVLKNADLITSCFAILEKAVQDLLGDNIEMREKDQIIQSYSEAADAVMSTIAVISGFEDTVEQNKIFVYAMIEFLCSGFAYDVLSSDAEAYRCLPFIMKFAERSFREYEQWYDEPGSKSDPPVNLFEFLIPAFQHFATREDGQRIIIGHMDVILRHFDFSWRVVESAGSQLSKCARSSLSLLVKIAELLTDVILVKPEAIKGASQFSGVFPKITSMLPVLETRCAFNSLLATVSVLGLILIKHSDSTFEEQHPGVVAVLSGSLRFLKTYNAKVTSTDAAVFQVGDNTQFWVNIREIWLLGIHLLSSLLRTMPWIKQHIQSVSPEILEILNKESTNEPIAPDT